MDLDLARAAAAGYANGAPIASIWVNNVARSGPVYVASRDWNGTVLIDADGDSSIVDVFPDADDDGVWEICAIDANASDVQDFA